MSKKINSVLGTNLKSSIFNYVKNAESVNLEIDFGFKTNSDKVFDLNIPKDKYDKMLDYLLKKNTNLYNFKTIKGLIIGNIFLFNDLNKINSFLNRLKTLSENFILKDGGHLSRCPMIQLDVLRDFLEIRSAIATNRKLNSPIIQTLVKVMGDYFKIFPKSFYYFGTF